MKLSEAIRLGAMLRPQTSGALFYRLRDGSGIGSCALGAAAEALGAEAAIGITSERNADAFLDRQFRAFMRTKLTCPCADPNLCWAAGHQQELGVVIVTLNDMHKWSRERIADWVETVEKAAAPVEGVTDVAAPAGVSV